MRFKVSFHDEESWEMVDADNIYQVKKHIRKNRDQFPPGPYHVEEANESDIFFHGLFDRRVHDLLS